jgi:hypothetical protein
VKAASGGPKVLTSVEGIYKDGEVKLLERPQDLQEARVIVTFLPPTSAEARDRMLSRMRAGIPLGGPPYPTREEIYDRGRKA